MKSTYAATFRNAEFQYGAVTLIASDVATAILKFREHYGWKDQMCALWVLKPQGSWENVFTTDLYDPKLNNRVEYMKVFT